MRFKFNEEEHRYFIDGKPATNITRVAKIPDDRFKLEQHGKRMVALGLAMDHDLLEAVAAHAGDKDILDAYCRDAENVAKANRAARRGTAIHRITDRIDGGEELIPTAMALGVEAVWKELWESVGLEAIPEYIERFVVYPHERICGRFDRIARTRKGQLVIADTKTGRWELDYPHGAAVQLALLANAPLLVGPLNGNGETTEFEPMPDVDKRWGVLIHLPENGPARVVKLDIEAGWKAAQECCFTALRWRRVSKMQLVQPLAEIKPPPPPVVDEGAELTDFEVNRLRDDFKKCPTKAAVDAWLKQSIDSDQSFHPTPPHGLASERRAAIVRAAINWSGFDEDIVRAGLALLLGQEVQTSVPVGAAFGALTIEEANRFCLLADGCSVSFRDDGSPIVAVA